MAKYSEKQKLEAVPAYLAGDRGMRATAKAYDVSFDSLRGWIAGYRAHGVAGIRAKRRTGYDLHFKLQVLSRIRDDGLSYRQAAAMYNIRRFDVIGKWERAYQAGGLAALASVRQAEKSGMVLSPIMDLYNGEIVAYETAELPRLRMVQDMLQGALARLGPE